MEKRISFIEMQSVKSVAKAVDPILKQKTKLESQIVGLDAEFDNKARAAVERLYDRIKVEKAARLDALNAELEAKQKLLASMESGVVEMTGLHVTDLVVKAVETAENGTKTTKWKTTDIVTYDDSKKQYVIVIAENSPSEVKSEVVEAETEHNQMSWGE